MHQDRTGQPVHPSRLGWPFVVAFMPFGYAWIAWGWWAEIRQQIESANLPDEPGAAAIGPAGLALAGLTTRLLGSLSEAAAYTIWWKSRGARLPYWRFFSWIVALSVTDLFGFALRRAAADAPDLVRALAHALGGPAALDATAATGLAAAFGSLGVLTLLRIGMTGWAQARGIGRPLAGPLALTVSVWLLTRLVAWWSFDLLRGLSPVR